MKLKDNLVTWFKDLEKLRERIMQRLPDGIDKNEYELTKWSTMILHVREGIHQSYRPTITQMCLIRSVSTKSSTKGRNEAAPLMDVEQDYKLLDYFEMKRAWLRDWKDKLETWKASNSSNVPALAMGIDSIAYDPSIHETYPDQINPNGIISKNCWSCNGESCSGKRHPSCPHSGGMHFAPPRCKDAVYAKQKERQCFFYLKGECNKGESCNFSHSGVPNLGSGGVRQPFGGRGRGRGRGRKGRGRGGHNKRSGAFGYSPTTGKPYETLAIANHAKEQRAAGAATSKQTSPPKKLKQAHCSVEAMKQNKRTAALKR